MSEIPHDEIRRLLKTFGIAADEALTVHFARPLQVPDVRVRITLTDLTDYGDHPPDEPLEVSLESLIRTDH